MFVTKKTANLCEAFTLVELMVVIAIILVIAALAAAFAPRVSDNTNLTRATDNLEQWLLTAKMRAKRDGLATGLRFIPDPNNPTLPVYYQLQYIQQPDPLSGGSVSTTASTGSVPAPPPYASNLSLTGSILLQTPNPPTPLPSSFLYPCPRTLAPPVAALVAGQVQIYNFDPTLGGVPSPSQWLVQSGDYLEINGGGVYYIASVGAPSVTTTSSPPSPWTQAWPVNNVPVTTLQLGGTTYDTALSITTPTSNFRILRQPRILIGEDPLNFPNNFAVDTVTLAGATQPPSSGNFDILFSPSGAVVGTYAGSGRLFFYVHDMTQSDPNMVSIVAVQCTTGFIGAYSVAPGADPFYFAKIGRESGL